jgi:toxin CptA
MKVYTRMREIELKPSRLLGLLLAGMALLAWLAITLAALPASVQWVLAAGIGILSGWAWLRASRLPRLRIAADGALQVLDDTDAWCTVEVLGDSFASTVLIVLRYRLERQGARSLTLLPDSAPADDLRRLRVALRWIRRTRSDTSSPDAG